jgi:cytochrome c biogenesis protein CcmG/thiol:disulfide interchange protein DsbE
MRYLIPVGVLAALIAVFWVGLHRDPREIPSPLIGKPAPAFDLPAIDGAGGRMTEKDLRGHARLVNFFASWCAGCQEEHGYLMHLGRDEGVEIVGVDYKDAESDYRNWIGRRGNPYRVVLADAQGQTGIDWGVYGVPETFVVNAQGTIVYKQIGPMTPEAWQKIKPMLTADAAAPSARQ